jgi:hypothetical protein
VLAAFGFIDVIRAPETEYVVGAFTENGVEFARRLDEFRQLIVIYQFGVSKYARCLAEEPFHSATVFVHLLDELAPRIYKTEAVIIRLGEELHAARLGKGVKSAEYFGTVLFELFEQRAGYAVRDFESALVFAYQLENHSVCGQVTFVGDLAADGGVFVVIEIIAALVEDGVVPKSKRLVYLKVKNYRSH